MHVNTVFSNLHISLKADFAESTIHLQATTRGDISVQKSIFVGVKKACAFNLPTALVTANHIKEFVFDRGAEAELYSLNDLVTVVDVSTSNVAEGSTYQDWGSSTCNIDMIIYERISDSVHSVNKTQTTMHQAE
jgi:hypothetical protein